MQYIFPAPRLAPPPHTHTSTLPPRAAQASPPLPLLERDAIMDHTARNKLVPLVKGLVAMRILNLCLSVCTVVLSALGAAQGLLAQAWITAYLGPDNEYDAQIIATVVSAWPVAVSSGAPAWLGPAALAAGRGLSSVQAAHAQCMQHHTKAGRTVPAAA